MKRTGAAVGVAVSTSCSTSSPSATGGRRLAGEVGASVVATASCSSNRASVGATVVSTSSSLGLTLRSITSTEAGSDRENSSPSVGLYESMLDGALESTVKISSGTARFV